MAGGSEQRGRGGSQPTGMGSGLGPARDTPQQCEGGPEPPSPALGWPLCPHHVLLAPGSLRVTSVRSLAQFTPGAGTGACWGDWCPVQGVPASLSLPWLRRGGRGHSPVPGPPAASPLPCPMPQPIGGDFTTSIRVSSPLRPSGAAGGAPPWLAGHPWVLSLAQTLGAAGEASSAGRAPAGSPQLPQPGPEVLVRLGPCCSTKPGALLRRPSCCPSATEAVGLPQLCLQGREQGLGAAGGCGGWQCCSVGSPGGAPSLSRAPKASGRGRAPWGQGQSLSCHRQGHGWRTPGPRACVTWGAGAGCWGASAPLIPGGQGWVPRGVPRHLPPPLPGC